MFHLNKQIREGEAEFRTQLYRQEASASFINYLDMLSCVASLAIFDCPMISDFIYSVDILKVSGHFVNSH